MRWMIIALLLAGCSETGSIETFFCPKSNCSEILAGVISSSNGSVKCAFFELSEPKVEKALFEKRAELVLDERNDLPGHIVDRSSYMHNKFCIIDGKIVTTGSFNPKTRESDENNNNLLVIRSEKLARIYSGEFDELFADKRSVSDSNKVTLNKNLVEVYFLPEDKIKALASLKSLIRKAKKNILVAQFSFTSDDLAKELISAKDRGIEVRVIMEKLSASGTGSEFQRLLDAGIDVKTDKNKANMHHKFIVVDGEVVGTGSPNWSRNAFDENDENLIIIHDRSVAKFFYEEFINLA